MGDLLAHVEECAHYYEQKLTPDQAPELLKRARHAVVLARSSDYYHYHLEDQQHFKLVICDLHDSYLHLPVWEMRTNKRYKPRETAVAITTPEFEPLRRTQFGHSILVAALAKGDQAAITLVEQLPVRTKSRLHREKVALQETRYRGRPLAFLTDAERREIGNKISMGLLRYYEQKRAGAV